MSAKSQMELSPERRVRLGQLADCLISGGSGMPSASQVDVQGAWIDRTLAARPDLAPIVDQVVAADGEPKQVLDDLRRQDRAKFNAFAFAISGAYLINPRIRKLLGYPGPAPTKNTAFPDEAESYLEDGILDVVINRGPIYRSTAAG